MNFDNVTVHISVSRDHLLYCFKADTPEEFERRFEQLANSIQMKIDNELFKKVMKIEVRNDKVHQ